MDLPAVVPVQVHAVLQFPRFLPDDPSLDERFIVAARPHFPNVIQRVPQFADSGPQTPRVVLSSSSSQLVLAGSQVDFEVRFYGGFRDDLERALGYVADKCLGALHAVESLGVTPSNLGFIATLRYPLQSENEAVEHILKTLLKSDVHPSDTQDASARIAVRIRDTYFVTLTIANYESRLIERPVIPGVPYRVRPWDGKIAEAGLELIVDINNNLESRVQSADPVVSEEGILAAVRLLGAVSDDIGPAYVRSGALPVDQLTDRSLR